MIERKDVPNGLTLLRIATVPVMVVFFYVPADWGAWMAGAAFTLAAVTDFFDGYLARRIDSVSAFGKLMDPIADKMLVAAALFCLVAFERLAGISIVAAILILLREILISGLREYLAAAGSAGIPVTLLAKWKTAVQMAAIAVLIVAPALDSGWIDLVGEVGIWLAAVLTVITGWDYLRHGLKRISDISVGQAG